MIQEFFSGMFALMLAKFVLNDVPHYLFTESTRRVIRIVPPAPPRREGSRSEVIGTPTGTCYPDAWRYTLQHPEGMLVHGTAVSLGRRLNHAWVELPDGTVWEPYSQAILSIKRFYALVDPVAESRYTAVEAAILAARVGKHGPWSEEERKEYLER